MTHHPMFEVFFPFLTISLFSRVKMARKTSLDIYIAEINF